MQTQYSDTFARIVKYIGEYLEADVTVLTPDSRLATAIPGLDSLKLVELMLYLEEKFGIELEDEVLGTVDSMRDLTRYIEDRLAAKIADA